MDKTISVAHIVGDKVKIKISGVVGTVKSVWCEADATRYEVRYLDANNLVCTTYFNAGELEAVAEETTTATA